MKFWSCVAVLFCSAGLLSFLFVPKCKILFEGKKKLSLCPSPYFTKKFLQRMNLFVEEQEKVTTPLSFLAGMIVEQFSAVEKVRIERSSDAQLKIQIFPRRPVAVINTKKLLTRDGVYLSTGDLSSDLIAALPRINVAENVEKALEVSSEFQRFVNVLRPEIYQSYHVTWSNKNRIELQDRYYPNILLLATYRTDFSDTFFESYKKITQTARSIAANKLWGIDARFKNQMILFDQKGERR